MFSECRRDSYTAYEFPPLQFRLLCPFNLTTEMQPYFVRRGLLTIWTPSLKDRWAHWNFWILIAVFCCGCSCADWNWHGSNFSCLADLWTFVRENPVYCESLHKDFGGDREKWLFLLVCGEYYLSELFGAGYSAQRRHFHCPEMLLSLGVFLFHAVHPCQDTHC
jgi:hypothetical protein